MSWREMEPSFSTLPAALDNTAINVDLPRSVCGVLCWLSNRYKRVQQPLRFVTALRQMIYQTQLAERTAAGYAQLELFT